MDPLSNCYHCPIFGKICTFLFIYQLIIYGLSKTKHPEGRDEICLISQSFSPSVQCPASKNAVQTSGDEGVSVRGKGFPSVEGWCREGVERYRGPISSGADLQKTNGEQLACPGEWLLFWRRRTGQTEA